MKYRNTETGAVIDVSSKMGGCWKPLKEKEPKDQKEKTGDETEQVDKEQ